MPKGKLHRFTTKEHGEAMHVKETYLKRGLSGEEAERRGWATVQAHKKPSIGDLRRGGKGKHH